MNLSRIASARNLRNGFVILAVAYVLLRVRIVFDAPPDTNYPDTEEYLRTAGMPLLSTDFWAGVRSPGLALYFKVVGTGRLAEIGHVGLSVVAWLALASEVGRTLVDRRAKVLGACSVLAFSLTSWLVQWDPIMLSESLALSSTAGLLACWLAAAREPTWPKLVLLIVLALVWSTVRDAHAYVLIAALIVPCMWWVRSHRKVKPAVLVAALGVVGMGSIASANAGLRWKGPLTNVLGDWILKDAEATAFFQERGLPHLSPEIESLLQTPGFIDVDALARQRDWAEIDRWIEREGRRTYTRYLATHPGVALTTTWKRRGLALNVVATGTETRPPLSNYRPAGLVDVIPSWFNDLLFPPTGRRILVYGAMIGVAAVIGWRRTRLVAARWNIALIVVALTIPHLFVVVLGDAVEITRHALTLNVMLRFGLLLIVMLLVDDHLGESRPKRVAAGDGRRQIRFTSSGKRERRSGLRPARSGCASSMCPRAYEGQHLGRGEELG